ncbi:MAG: type II secretion system F family protein [Gemmatimonadetes bacterium]|nr:type II secretion system F family protein [Gemmatimonadota bacterium]
MSAPANLAPAILVFAAVALGVLSLVFLWEWWVDRRRRKEIVDRLGGLTGEGPRKEGDPFGDLFRDEELTDVRWLKPLVARLPHARDLQHLIDQADLDWRVGSFVLYTVGGAVGFGLAAWVMTKLAIVALAAAAFGATLPYLYVKRKKAKRIERFEEHFPEAIDLLGRAIRAGHAFSTGLGMVAEESPEPVSAEFRRVFEEQRFGLSIEDSMLALADRIDLLDMRIFVTALLIQREVGGNLAEILDKIAHTIRERFTIQRQVRVYTAQGRFTGYLLAVLPIGVGALIGIMNHEYMSILFTEPTGRMMISVALLLQVVGFFAIRRIIDIEI